MVFSGGEPTLNPRLEHWARFAKQLTGHDVTLQTNAVLLDNADRARSVASAGIGHAFVSLHGSRAIFHPETTGVMASKARGAGRGAGRGAAASAASTTPAPSPSPPSSLPPG